MGSFHSAWSPKEEEQLFESVRRARQKGLPLKTAFSETAERFHRKPDSVRNYYYARLRQYPEPGLAAPRAAFVPFRPEEARALLKSILLARSRGLSVRATALSMAHGDERQMLRYQNKYRSLLKRDPALVRAVREELLKEGHPVPDPLSKGEMRTGPGRPRKEQSPQETELVRLRRRFDALLSLHRQLFELSRSLLSLSPSPPSPALKEALSQQLEDSEKRLAQIL